MIDKLPSWARPGVEQFLQTGRIDGTRRTEVQLETQLSHTLDRFERARSQDDGQQDLAPGRGRTLLPTVMGAAETHYNDNQLVFTISPNVVVYAEDDGRVAREVVVTRCEGFHEVYAGQADRLDPANCYYLRND
jgi:hypothetical protein